MTASGPAAALVGELWRLLRARQWTAAQAVGKRLTGQFPELPAAWHGASHVALACGRGSEALSHADRALLLAPRDVRLLIHRGHCLFALGRLADLCETAATAMLHAPEDAAVFDAIGSLFVHGNAQQHALLAYERAVQLAPGDPKYLYNRATVLRFLGRMADSEADYDRVIALRPGDYEAYKNRSDLRTQTAARNHVQQIERLLAPPPADWRGGVQLHYALAKEYEDLGHHQRSFEQLRRGARLRREHLRYDVAIDEATVDWIMAAFPCAQPAPAPGAEAAAAGGAAPGDEAGAARDAPIFVVGLPRTGTTLVERILGSHSAIHAAGELNHFAVALVDAVRRQSGREQLPRQELVARSAALDFAALGHDYLARVRAAGIRAPRFTDKMPLNYLYCGLIRRALPNARIVHVTRHPMAACYAMYKTLFADGYPFSYDLGEIARYYIAYRRLMRHWQDSMPGGMHTLAYESLIGDQTGETRRLLAFCGLPWEDACARFEDNPAPSLTASAAQVRRPLYDSSVAQWRQYAAQLGELSGRLAAAGIDVT